MSRSGAQYARVDKHLITVPPSTGDYTKDTAMLQAILNTVPEHSTITLTDTYLITSVVLNTRYVKIEGPGNIYGGKLQIGETVTRRDLFITISGVSFEAASTNRTAGTYGIEFLKARAVRVVDCTFANHDKNIYVNPLTNGGIHDVAMLDIYHNNFTNCNYAFYGDRDDAVSWMYMSDSHFVDNTVNLAYICQVWVKSIDGFHCNGNTFFFPAYTTANTTKTNNIYVGQSSWLHVKHNNLFEAGLEAIWLDQPSRFEVSDNLIAWPGQRTPSDAIKLTGSNTLNGLMADNVISKMSGNGISIYCTGAGTVAIKNTMVEYDSTSPAYYGTPALNTFTHYSIIQDAASTVNVFTGGTDSTGGVYENRKGSLTTALRITNDTAISAAKAPVTFTAATANAVFTLNSQRFGQLTFSGLVIMEVKSADSESSNLAVYTLVVSKTNAYAVTQLGAQGLTAGSSANWPSFTWTIDASGKLTATPVGSTAGTFYFFGTTMGNLRLT